MIEDARSRMFKKSRQYFRRNSDKIEVSMSTALMSGHMLQGIFAELY